MSMIEYPPGEAPSLLDDVLSGPQDEGWYTPPDSFGAAIWGQPLTGPGETADEAFDRIDGATMDDLLGLQQLKEAQALTSDIFFFEYVPQPFMPMSAKAARAQLNSIGSEILGRRLRADELNRGMSALRSSEHQFYNSQIRIARMQHARQLLADLQAAKARYGAQSAQYAEQIEYMETNGIDTTVLEEYTSLEDFDAALTEQSKQAISAAQEDIRGFAPYSEDDYQLAIREELAALSPHEEMGQTMRSTLDGWMQAIRGYANVDAFTPR